MLLERFCKRYYIDVLGMNKPKFSLVRDRFFYILQDDFYSDTEFFEMSENIESLNMKEILPFLIRIANEIISNEYIKKFRRDRTIEMREKLIMMKGKV
jgi:hypothetical protein